MDASDLTDPVSTLGDIVFFIFCFVFLYVFCNIYYIHVMDGLCDYQLSYIHVSLVGLLILIEFMPSAITG